jgi:urease accessory protein
VTPVVPIRPGELGIDVVADAAGRTRTTGLRQRYPQRVTTALRCESGRLGAVTLCVQSPSGGAFSDDDLRTTVRCHPGAYLHLTTQAATQVFAGDGPGARHRLHFTVRSGAVLEYSPGTVIPHTDAAFQQQIDIQVDPSGVYLGWEALSAGRIAHGERFGYSCYDSAFTVRVDDRVVARDRQLIRPSGSPPCSSMIDGDYLSTFVAVTPGSNTEALLARMRTELDGLDGCRAGAGRLPCDAGVFVRAAVAGATELRRLRLVLFDAARTHITPADRSTA